MHHIYQLAPMALHPTFMVGDTLLLAFLPAAQLYRHCIRKDQPPVSEWDIAFRILKVRVLATIGEQTATVHYLCPLLTDRKEQPTRLQTAFTQFCQRRTLRLAKSRFSVCCARSRSLSIRLFQFGCSSANPQFGVPRHHRTVTFSSTSSILLAFFVTAIFYRSSCKCM
ncbi:hypothetical protein BDN71DRAFT_359981 [Pleurotus eryngii]|uniref:Uncharacterized protein n=1 Tax=Pleurotus eryngii TaxID=5323 RepID=A0A9P5ZJF1_PLEER|nr:hypothetical protein BDN71DRAFT_359981 [Pleurotus eryngii]